MIRNFIQRVIPLLALNLLVACVDNEYENMKVNYPNAFIPETVTPFGDANSEFDDFNAGPNPVLSVGFAFYFSSNRSTGGGSFNVESLNASAIFDQNKGTFRLSGHTASREWPGGNSSANEYGPFIAPLADGDFIYLYASDITGNLDIYHTVYGETVEKSDALNSVSDDAYPSFGPSNSVYFTSNRGGIFDIYQANIPDSEETAAWLATGSPEIVRVETLNSSGDDKCPYVNGDLLVLTSNREGGFGGYDLYYSVYEEGLWSEPINFGPSINTEYDEYRPVVIYAPGYKNDLLIFSSNRPGGKGGFDLYYVGIPKMTARTEQ